MIQLENVMKKFGDQMIIDELSLKVEDSEIFVITGSSGSGKTTLLNILSLLEKPDKGDLWIDACKNPSNKETLLLQRNEIAYLFQNYGLIDNLTVEKNLMVALAYEKIENPLDKIKEVLEVLNIEEIQKKPVFQLSGGEQQRVAMARVILKDPKYIFADEPTGNLDKENAKMIVNLLNQLNDLGKTIVLVTHEYSLLKNLNKYKILNLKKH